MYAGLNESGTAREEAIAALDEEKEKNASLEKKLAQSDKANEALCAGLSSAKEQNDETNKMLSDLIKTTMAGSLNNRKEKVMEVLPDNKKRKAETCDDTKTSTFDYKVEGINGSYVGGYTHCPRQSGSPRC